MPRPILNGKELALTKPNGRSVPAAIFSRFLWLIILTPILAVSGYSLFWIARHFGVPWFIAIAMSTCFDGVCLLSADYSLRYAQAGMSGSVSRRVVWLFAFVAAFLQTYHARLGNEPPGAWIMWAALPIGAVLVYEQHIRWERRTALARAGHIYPAPIPQWGLASWILFPMRTLNGENGLRDIVSARSNALGIAAKASVEEFTRAATRVKPSVEALREAKPRPEPAEAAQPRDSARTANVIPIGKPRAPKIHIREWGRANGWPHLSDRARLPREVEEAYGVAHPESRSG